MNKQEQDGHKRVHTPCINISFFAIALEKKWKEKSGYFCEHPAENRAAHSKAVPGTMQIKKVFRMALVCLESTMYLS